MGVKAFTLWNNHGGKAEEVKKYDYKCKEIEIERIIEANKDIAPQQHLNDLHETFLDA